MKAISLRGFSIPLALLSSLSFSLACDRTPKKLEFIPEGRAVPEVIVSETGGSDAGKSVNAEKEELPLALVVGVGSTMRFLDGRALTAYYSNIFPKRAYGFEICANINDPARLPAEASACTDSIFNAAEIPSMGTFSMNMTASNRGAQNVLPPQNLTLNYMRTLRSALSRECGYLVKTERAALKANTIEKNSLIKAAAPSPADLEEFFRTILGLKGSGLKVDIGAADYVAAFNQVVASATAANKEKAADEAYLGLCIALAMNPQVIIY